MNLTKIIEGYDKRVKQAEKYLTQLSKRAERLGQAQEQREDVRERIKSAEMQISACVGVKAALKDEFTDALYNDDAEQQQTIRNQREVLEDEIRELETEIEKAETELDKSTVSAKELAEVRALLDSFKPVSYADLLESIEAELKQANRELQSLARDARSTLPPSHLDDKVTYSQVREANDPIYKSQEQRERYLRRQDAERKAKLARYGDASNTDQLHQHIGSPGGSRATINVVEDGSKETPYARV